MGIETAAVVVTAVIAGASAYEQRRQSKKAAEKEEDAQAVAKAEQQAQQMEKTRAQIREERVRRSQIMQSSANTGTAGSSSEAGAVSSLGTQLGANIGSMTRQANSANAISSFQQDAADARAKGAQAAAFGEFASGAVDLFSVGYSAYQADNALTQASQPSGGRTKTKKS